jgi:hypothetical protein
MEMSELVCVEMELRVRSFCRAGEGDQKLGKKGFCRARRCRARERQEE